LLNLFVPFLAIDLLAQGNDTPSVDIFGWTRVVGNLLARSLYLLLKKGQDTNRVLDRYDALQTSCEAGVYKRRVVLQTPIDSILTSPHNSSKTRARYHTVMQLKTLLLAITSLG
jgi:hypothetical protein